MVNHPKRPRDVNQLGVAIGRIATGEETETPEPEKNPAAVELGRKGGRARADRQTPEERQAAARRAVEKRWAGKTSDEP